MGPGPGQVSTPCWPLVSLLSRGMSKPPQQGLYRDSWNLYEGGPGRASTRRTPGPLRQLQPPTGWAAHSGHTIRELSPQRTHPQPHRPVFCAFRARVWIPGLYRPQWGCWGHSRSTHRESQWHPGLGNRKQTDAQPAAPVGGLGSFMLVFPRLRAGGQQGCDWA